MLGVLATIGFALAGSPLYLILAFLAVGLVTGVSEPAERTLVARLAPKGAGHAFGQAQALQGVGALAAGLAFGAVVDARGSATALLISAAATVGTTVVWLVVMKPRTAER